MCHVQILIINNVNFCKGQCSKLSRKPIDQAKKEPKKKNNTTEYTMINQKTEKEQFLLPFVTTYNPKHFNIFQEAKKNSL